MRGKKKAGVKDVAVIDGDIVPLKVPNDLAQGVIEGWIPSPDMGTIQPPPAAVKACVHCGHEKGHHYGSQKEWCNVRGCNCQEFK